LNVPDKVLSVNLEVNGVPITEGEFKEQLDYELSYREIKVEGEEAANPFVMTEEEIKKEIFKKMLIPMAAVKSKYGDRFPALMREAESIKKEIAPDRSNFARLAAEYSKDTNAKEGGAWRIVTRFALYYPVTRFAFTAKQGDVRGPFMSLAGCHLIWVQKKTQGMLAADDNVEASHILLPFQPDRPDFIPVVIDELVGTARIEVIDPEFAKYVPAGDG
jgi:parvulin-like peptidyl-prolyl isomerase